MEFELGLWRSTLGDTHPHLAVAVEMDWWPQSAHVTELRFEGTAAPLLVGGLVGCDG